MTTREAQKLREALENIRGLRQELEITKKMLEGCEQNRLRLEKRVTDLLADLTAISRMDGRE